MIILFLSVLFIHTHEKNALLQMVVKKHVLINLYKQLNLGCLDYYSYRNSSCLDILTITSPRFCRTACRHSAGNQDGTRSATRYVASERWSNRDWYYTVLFFLDCYCWRYSTSFAHYQPLHFHIVGLKIQAMIRTWTACLYFTVCFCN